MNNNKKGANMDKQFDFLTETQRTALDAQFPGWEPQLPEVQEEVDFDKPIKGGYEAEIKEVKFKTTSTEKEIVNFSLQINKDIKGDKSSNRYIYIDFWMGSAPWDEDPAYGIKQLITSITASRCGKLVDLKNCGNPELFATDLNNVLKGQTVAIKCWIKKKKEEDSIERQGAGLVQEQAPEAPEDDSWS